MEFHDIESVLDECVELIENHRGLINAYITDFFVGARHEVPLEWLSSLSRLKPHEIGMTMKEEADEEKRSNLDRLPSSFMGFRHRCCRLNMNEGSVGDIMFRRSASKQNDAWLGRLGRDLHECPHNVPAHLRKVMKPKKQHEVLRQGLAISAAANAVNVARVIDVGSGHGHLARLLAFQQGLDVTAIEAADQCAPKASRLDQEVTYRLNRRSDEKDRSNGRIPEHITSVIGDGPSVPLDGLPLDLGSVLTGLHACGDLTAILLRRFSVEVSLKALVSVGCCYMRCEAPWKPMSNKLRAMDFGLSFEALELACHHLASYRVRLIDSRCTDTIQLRGQAFRAGFTALLARGNHKLQHGTGVRCGFKVTPGLTFRRYAESLMSRLHLDDLDVSEDDWKAVEQDVDNEWRSVIAFCSVRLMLGPVVELTILLDRLLFLREQGFQNSCLLRLFDSSLSPRNLAIFSWKD